MDGVYEGEARTIGHAADERDAVGKIRQWFDTPIHQAVVSWSDEAADIRAVSVQVRDRLRRDWPGRYFVAVYITTTEDGAPSGAGHAVTFTTGTVLATWLADGAYLVLTDASGLAEFNLQVAGAATRHVYTSVLGAALGSGAIAWT